MLRTLFLTQTYPRYATDTAGPFIREIALGMVRAGDEVTILVPHTRGLAAEWDDAGLRVKSFRYAPEALEVVGYSRSLERDEVLKLGSTVAAPLYALGARRAVAKTIRAADQPFDVFHAHWIVPNGIATTPLFPRPNAERRPVVGFGLHGSDVFLAERSGVRGLVRRSLSKADFLTGCSPELVDRVSALGDLGGPSATTAVIPYGIDARAFEPGTDRVGWRERLRIGQTSTVVLGVGRMATKKGFQVLLEAAPGVLGRHPDVHFVLAGGGDRESEFKTQVQEQDVLRHNVHFPGLVERDELSDLYRAADIFCLPAVHDEKGNVDGLPNVILEAMASGLPVVASNVSGIPQAVVDGETGRLVAEQQAGELAQALDQLLSDQDLCTAMGEAGRTRVRQGFTWDSTAARYRATYLSALGRSSEDMNAQGHG